MRFEIMAAYGMGVALPALEVCRRGRDLGHVAAYADDFVAGALLLAGARAASKGRPAGWVLLLVAWSVLCGGFYSSFFGQVESTARLDVSGLPNLYVVGIKGLLYAVSIAALLSTAARLARLLDPSAPKPGRPEVTEAEPLDAG